MGELVSFASDGTGCDGYLAVPAAGSGPGVIVVQEWWGLVRHIRDVADRLAREGFVTLAPDLFHGIETKEPDEGARLMMGMAMDRAARDIGGAADYLADRAEVTSSGIGAVGFCMGGSLSLWSATLSDRITVAVGFYPALPWERMDPTWSNYTGKHAVIHADEDDGGAGAPSVQQARKGIETAGGTVEVYDYPGTHHAFFNDDRPEVYNRAQAEIAWRRTLDTLRTRLR